MQFMKTTFQRWPRGGGVALLIFAARQCHWKTALFLLLWIVAIAYIALDKCFPQLKIKNVLLSHVQS